MAPDEALAFFQALPEDQQAAVLGFMSEVERTEFMVLLENIDYVHNRTLLHRVYPDHGALARSRYEKQMELYELGAAYQFRCLMGGNGTGKTWAGGIEIAYHATGRYPPWWKGYRFKRGITIWVAGDTIHTVRDILQYVLMGEQEHFGTGFIPAADIVKWSTRPNSGGALDWVVVKHKSGGRSRIHFKSYDQGRKAFQGRSIPLIWLDEECPMPIFQECVQRFRATAGDGRLLLTFTPLSGITDVVRLFMPWLGAIDVEDEDAAPRSPGDLDPDALAEAASRVLVTCGWEDIPHMTEQEKRRRLLNTLPFEREARMRGIPTSGRGRIFIVEEDAFVVPPFRIPPHWPRLYGADFGYGATGDRNTGTAAAWIAWDPDTDTAYVYDEYFRHQAPPSTHAAAIKARGDWIRGVGDYAGKDLEGNQTLDIYTQQGLKIVRANKSVYAGLQLMTQLLNEGRLRVFSTCAKWLEEYRLYSFNEKNQVIKERDHLMDATRYALMAPRNRATTPPIPTGRAAVVPAETFGLYSRR